MELGVEFTEVHGGLINHFNKLCEADNIILN
jgi:hypothetical protein